MIGNLDDLDNLISQYFMKYPENFYERMLLGPMSEIYSARKDTGYHDWMSFSNLLIDKFVIHSMSLFHLSKGIVERKIDGTTKIAVGYDLFSVHALFRTMMETYMAFHWIFIAPKLQEEKEFRFLLWKLDGLFDKRKFEISEDVKAEAVEILIHDEKEKSAAVAQLEQNIFYLSLDMVEVGKVFDPIKNKAIWRYEQQPGLKLRQLKIVELVQMTTRTEAFLNLYRYSSMYTHANYISVDKFCQMRGQLVKDDYAQPLIRQAILLTTLLIDDMCQTDQNAARTFAEQDFFVQRFILQMSSYIRSIPVRKVR